MPSEKQYRERRENIFSILQHIRVHGPQSRRQLCEALDLSWGCVSELVSILLVRNILMEDGGQSVKTKGRTPSLLRLNGKMHFLGVDINRNGLNACVCNLLGEKVAAYRDTLHCSCKQALIDSVCGFVDKIVNEKICGICFAMQGIASEDKQVWSFPGEEPIVIDFSVDFQGRFHVPFTVEHDPDCILYGCLEESQKSMMILRLDRGIGAAVYTGSGFLENDLLEVGHLVVNEKGQRLQDIVSLNAVEAALGTDFDPKAAATQGFFAGMGKYLGMTLGNLCNLFRLDKICICGDMVKYYPYFSHAMAEQYGKTVLPGHSAQLTTAEVTDAGYGGAKMAMDKFQY